MHTSLDVWDGIDLPVAFLIGSPWSMIPCSGGHFEQDWGWTTWQMPGSILLPYAAATRTRTKTAGDSVYHWQQVGYDWIDDSGYHVTVQLAHRLADWRYDLAFTIEYIVGSLWEGRSFAGLAAVIGAAALGYFDTILDCKWPSSGRI